jgi:hypothetical protein
MIRRANQVTFRIFWPNMLPHGLLKAQVGGKKRKKNGKKRPKAKRQAHL